MCVYVCVKTRRTANWLGLLLMCEVGRSSARTCRCLFVRETARWDTLSREPRSVCRDSAWRLQTLCSLCRRDKLWISMEYCGGGSLQDIYHGENSMHRNTNTLRHICSLCVPSSVTHLSLSYSLFRSSSNRAFVRVTDSLHVTGNPAGSFNDVFTFTEAAFLNEDMAMRKQHMPQRGCFNVCDGVNDEGWQENHEWTVCHCIPCLHLNYDYVERKSLYVKVRELPPVIYLMNEPLGGSLTLSVPTKPNRVYLHEYNSIHANTLSV